MKPTLPPAVRRAILDAARRARDAEPCGYLLGPRGGDGCAVTRAVRGANVHPRPRHAFRLGLDEQLRVARAARAEGLRVVGHWHAHLLGPARPSAADVRGAGGPLAAPLLVVAGRDERGAWTVRGWRLPADAQALAEERREAGAQDAPDRRADVVLRAV